MDVLPFLFHFSRRLSPRINTETAVSEGRPTTRSFRYFLFFFVIANAKVIYLYIMTHRSLPTTPNAFRTRKLTCSTILPLATGDTMATRGTTIDRS
ncbi:hypothetical protein G7K_3521-t1 [Saitoella complicata NRRL Y-17804]|uniref:Uncharacterized protein n=1 Tax=Saitoella complicata (strain BCRC 22490 / CBS 7301 / JCM 7358 / NBRC 10748 / NRRL Y-17804) TaxID=698492 RepID=A0A0E9NJ08_SAICN|nr:hypothetical protein G7K_3521-t1 [Saitoella complicata NRRL Y-17804]